MAARAAALILLFLRPFFGASGASVVIDSFSQRTQDFTQFRLEGLNAFLDVRCFP